MYWHNVLYVKILENSKDICNSKKCSCRFLQEQLARGALSSSYSKSLKTEGSICNVISSHKIESRNVDVGTFVSIFHLGGDYINPFCRQEVSPYGNKGKSVFIPTGRDMFRSSICLQKPIDSHWFKNIHKMMKFNQGICLLFSHRLTSYAS